MTNIAHTLIAKSDQLNAADLIGGEKLLKITSVDVKSASDVWVHYEGENGRPWKTSLTARRILARLWTEESDNWIGHTVAVHCDPTVVYAGEEVGGIRPHAATGIDSERVIKLKERRGPKPKTFKIVPLRLDSSPQAKPTRIEFSMETYTRAIEKIISESETHDELQTRFDRMSDWRKQAAQTDSEKATELRERVNARLAELADA